MNEFIKAVVFPFIVAVVTYLLFKRLDEWSNRRKYSRLGVAVIESLLEEVTNGVRILESFHKTREATSQLLPRRSWSGMNTISDEVLLRIIEVSKNIKPKGFHPREIRIHCKNYFEHMTFSWDYVSYTKADWQKVANGFIDEGKYVEAAQNVKFMLVQTKELLERNSNKWFPN
jgi:hypothetical protein